MPHIDPSDLAVEVRALSKSYGRVRVLDGLDLSLGWGQVLSVLGPNGSGKTTLLRALATLTSPDSGSVMVAGMDAVRDAGRVRRVVGVVMHEPMLYGNLTGEENLRFSCRMFNLDHADERIAEASRRVGIQSSLGRRAGDLSHGMQKRLSLARALLHRPRILLLDEPESGLDQSGNAMLREVVESVRDGGGSVLMATHDIDQAALLSDGVAILSHGSVARRHVPGPAGEGAARLREIYSGSERSDPPAGGPR